MNNLSTSIATTREQSERLLAMGVKPETADCYLEQIITDDWENYQTCIIESWINQKTMFEIESIKPAWSLSRLISMLPTNINGYSLDINFDNKSIEYSKVNCCDTTDCLYIEGHDDLFESIIAVIAWLIKSNHFNKEYLK